jgi:hypothetical protein
MEGFLLALPTFCGEMLVAHRLPHQSFFLAPETKHNVSLIA